MHAPYTEVPNTTVCDVCTSIPHQGVSTRKTRLRNEGVKSCWAGNSNRDSERETRAVEVEEMKDERLVKKVLRRNG